MTYAKIPTLKEYSNISYYRATRQIGRFSFFFFETSGVWISLPKIPDIFEGSIHFGQNGPVSWIQSCGPT